MNDTDSSPGPPYYDGAESPVHTSGHRPVSAADDSDDSAYRTQFPQQLPSPPTAETTLSSDPLPEYAIADRTEAGTGQSSTAAVRRVIPALRRFPTSLRHPRAMLRRPVDAVVVARRSERRAARHHHQRLMRRWLGARGWWALRGLGITIRAVWRLVWQPDRPAYISALMDANNPEFAVKERGTLRRERRNSVALTLILTSAGYFAVDNWGDDLVAVIPWWTYPAAVAVLLPVLAVVGWPGRATDPDQHVLDMPRSLRLSDSDAGVANTLMDAFTGLKIRATVSDGGVRREPRGWGWTVTLEVLDNITEPKLADLERHLNTPTGGLIFSRARAAARVMTLRIVMQDLLSTPTDAAERTMGSILRPTVLGTRFDGTPLELALFARHLLIIGRTGSGKSGALHMILDALTAATDMTVDGIDLSNGPDVKSWQKSLREHAFGPDLDKVEEILLYAVGLIQQRTARLGSRNWDPAVDGAGHAVVIDEYGLLAEVPSLRALVEYIATYGAKAGVSIILANHRLVNDMMVTSRLGSQVHHKFFMSMSTEDAARLPKALRELGVRPQLFQQATKTDPKDAGKTFAVDLDDLAVLARFHRLGRIGVVRRASERAPHRPRPTDGKSAPARRNKHGVPELVLAVRSAIFAISAAEGRTPPRAANNREIIPYLRKRGFPVNDNALVRELRKATGGFISHSSNVNLAPGDNPKGLYLKDLDNAITDIERLSHDNVNEATRGLGE